MNSIEQCVKNSSIAHLRIDSIDTPSLMNVMRCVYSWAVALLFAVAPVYGQTDYEELTVDEPVNMEAWNRLPSGVHVSWANTNVRYAQSEVPAIKKNMVCSLKGWKGEKLSALLAVWNNEADCTLSLKLSDLKGNNGNVISKEQLKAGFVRYVMTDEFIRKGKTSCGFRPNKAEWDSSLVADVIDVKEKHVLKKHQVSPIWVSVQVPQNVSKGKYTGEVIVYSNAHECQRLKLQVEVMNRELPKPSEWGFHLDLWQNPYAVARFHNVKVWSKEHFDLMRPVMPALADAGQKVVTTSIMHKPWNGQTYDYFESMIVWRKTLSGEWKFTFDVFDKWVEFMVSLGIDKQINCYSMVPWSYSFQYFDECTNKMQVVKCKPGEPAYNEMWTAFLTAFAKHLKEKTGLIRLVSLWMNALCR